jgi:transposase
LAHEQEAPFLDRLHAEPPPDSQLAAYRSEDLRHLLKDEFGVTYSLSGAYALLHRLGRPTAQEACKKSAAPAGSGSAGGSS